MYCGKTLKEEDLTKLTDKDSVRVILIPESKMKKPIDESHKTTVDQELKTLTAPFKNHSDNRIRTFYLDFNEPDDVGKIMKAFGTFMYTNPKLIDIFKQIIRPLAMKYGYNMEEQLGYQRQAAAAPITQALLQSALNAALAGVPMLLPVPQEAPRVAGPTSPVAATVPVRAPPPQPAEEPMQQGFEQQAATLREF